MEPPIPALLFWKVPLFDAQSPLFVVDGSSAIVLKVWQLHDRKHDAEIASVLEAVCLRKCNWRSVNASHIRASH
jgi:hypothetical protein